MPFIWFREKSVCRFHFCNIHFFQVSVPRHLQHLRPTAAKLVGRKWRRRRPWHRAWLCLWTASIPSRRIQLYLLGGRHRSKPVRHEGVVQLCQVWVRQKMSHDKCYDIIQHGIGLFSEIPTERKVLEGQWDGRPTTQTRGTYSTLVEQVIPLF